jgi:diguanylate cyclase (GGDEF)-like protein
METVILDSIKNGILITDKDLKISFWNKWLAVQTGISKENALGSTLNELFPETSFSILQRKVRIAFKINSPTFTNATIEQYVIPIGLNKITKSIFQYMRQETVITPINSEQVSIVIYDASPLLEANVKIDEQLKLFKKLSITDELTQCYNKTMFNKLLSAEIKKSARHDYFFSLIIFDIDDFKSVNDTYGHIAGDNALKTLASIARQNIRESDIFARWGGEEFCILLPDTELQGASVLADKVRQIICEFDFDTPRHLQCSFGISQYCTGNNENELVAFADKALYYAKNNGKNQVAVFDKGIVKAWQK